MKKMNQWIIIIGIAIVLIIAIVVLQKLGYQSPTIEGIEFIVRGEVSVVSDFSSVEPTDITLQNGEVIQVYRFEDMLALANVKKIDIEELYVTTIEGQRLRIALNELEDIYLKWENARLRLVYPKDGFRQRWLKNITTIEVL